MSCANGFVIAVPERTRKIDVAAIEAAVAGVRAHA